MIGRRTNLDGYIYKMDVYKLLPEHNFIREGWESISRIMDGKMIIHNIIESYSFGFSKMFVCEQP